MESLEKDKIERDLLTVRTRLTERFPDAEVDNQFLVQLTNNHFRISHISSYIKKIKEVKRNASLHILGKEIEIMADR